MMKRIALGIEYNGTGYYGWQCQENLTTLQGSLESALNVIANTPIAVICAGRTDAGVHAFGQVVHFDCDAPRSLDNWIMGGNTHLPDTIAIRWAKFVDDTFHARYSALTRSYRYVIYNHPIRSAIFGKNATGWHQPLDEGAMQSAANYWLGEHDFTSFRSINCQAKTAVRFVHECSVQRENAFIIIKIKANAFLHHMVRNMAGVLLAIGEGKKSPPWSQEVLLARDRKKAGITAPPNGLYLTEVEYPERFEIPCSTTDRHFNCAVTFYSVGLSNSDPARLCSKSC
jgi:tRNA pseudouridine38-40 synthase